MSRFALTTLLALTALLVLGAWLDGWTRIGILTILWVVYGTAVGLGAAFMRLQFFGPAACRRKTGKNRVALTFDDGPDPDSTPRLLELLKDRKVPAAFFCIGRRVDAHPSIVAHIHQDGHLLGNHTYNHRWYSGFFPSASWTRENTATQGAILRAAGIEPFCMRPPMGVTNLHLFSALKRAGLTLVGWDVRSLDQTGSVEEVVNRIVGQARDGSIILLHDGGVPPDRVLQIAGDSIRELRSRGFEFERLDRLLEGAEAPK